VIPPPPTHRQSSTPNARPPPSPSRQRTFYSGLSQVEGTARPRRLPRYRVSATRGAPFLSFPFLSFPFLSSPFPFPNHTYMPTRSIAGTHVAVVPHCIFNIMISACDRRTRKSVASRRASGRPSRPLAVSPYCASRKAPEGIDRSDIEEGVFEEGHSIACPSRAALAISPSSSDVRVYFTHRGDKRRDVVPGREAARD
jgi:hypothetical protein